MPLITFLAYKQEKHINHGYTDIKIEKIEMLCY